MPPPSQQPQPLRSGTSDDEVRTARVLRVLLLTCIVATVILGLIAILFVAIRKGGLAVLLSGLLLVLLAALAVLRRGRVHGASAIFLCGFWAVCTVYAALGGGIRSGLFLLHLAITVAAGLLLGRRAAVAFAVATAALGLILTLQGVAGVLPTYFPGTLMGSWMALISCLVLLVTALHLVLRGVEESMDRLRRSEQRFRTIFDSINDAIVVHDLKTGEVLEANRRTQELYGYSAEELLGLDPARLSSGVPPHTHEEVLARAREATGGKPQIFEWRARRKDGTLRWVEVAMRRASVDGQDRLLVVVRDIDDRKRVEDQFIQAQKMEPVGRLAGGVAHDFNNLITVVSCSAEMIRATRNGTPETDESVKNIQEACHRAHDLTSQLLAFSRKQVRKPGILDLNQVLANSSKMLRRILGEDIQVTTPSSAEDALVYMDPGQLNQVIMNLAVNARDAMPDGGRLTFQTAVIRVGDGDEEPTPGARPGKYVRLTVSDTGCGMTREVLNQIFEPFFTTKDRGTGLGLSTVFGIVKQNEGLLTVDSAPGRGTTFEICFPYMPGRVRRPTPVQPVEYQGSRSVLVVEDAENLRRTIQKILEFHGFEVLVAGDAEDALRLERDHHGMIHLLLTDIVLPRIRGAELAALLCRNRPQLKVIYMTGYSDGAIGNQTVLGPDVTLLIKPFEPAELIRTIQEALEADPGRPSA